MLRSRDILGDFEEPVFIDNEEYGMIVDHSGNVVFDELAYLGYWGKETDA
jgi:hypothetical protein